MPLTEEGMTEHWTVTWFAPDGDMQSRHSTEERARRKAASEEVAAWNPILEHVITTVIAEVVPL